MIHHYLFYLGILFLIAMIVFGVIQHIRIKDNEMNTSTQLTLLESECGFVGVGLIAIACFLQVKK